MGFITYENHIDVFAYATPTPIYILPLFFGVLGLFLSTLIIFALIKFVQGENKVYARYLILQHINLFLFDLIIVLGIAPVALLPVPAGYATGFLAYWFHVPTVYMLTAAYFLLIGEAVCYFNLVLHRHQNLLPDGHPIKLRPKLFIIITSIISVNSFLSTLYFCLREKHDGNYSFSYFAEIYGIPNGIGQIPYLHFFDIRDFNAMAALISLSLTVFILYAILFLALLHCGYLVFKQSQAVVSPATRKLHKILLISMTFQLILPLICISIPGVLLIISAFFKIWFIREIGDIAMLFWSIHGCVSALTVLLVNKTFRKRIITYMNKLVVEDDPPIVRNNYSWLHK